MQGLKVSLQVAHCTTTTLLKGCVRTLHRSVFVTIHIRCVYHSNLPAGGSDVYTRGALVELCTESMAWKAGGQGEPRTAAPDCSRREVAAVAARHRPLSSSPSHEARDTGTAQGPTLYPENRVWTCTVLAGASDWKSRPTGLIAG